MSDTNIETSEPQTFGAGHQGLQDAAEALIEQREAGKTQVATEKPVRAIVRKPIVPDEAKGVRGLADAVAKDGKLAARTQPQTGGNVVG